MGEIDDGLARKQTSTRMSCSLQQQYIEATSLTGLPLESEMSNLSIEAELYNTEPPAQASRVWVPPLPVPDSKITAKSALEVLLALEMQKDLNFIEMLTRNPLATIKVNYPPSLALSLSPPLPSSLPLLCSYHCHTTMTPSCCSSQEITHGDATMEHQIMEKLQSEVPVCAWLRTSYK
jgi:hypothetical protein